jgi:putative acyl-CoA dehydrogenase
MFSQAEGGVMCPMAMSYSVVPSLRSTPGIEAEWMPRLMSNNYDPRDIPAAEKTGVLIGMFMTESRAVQMLEASQLLLFPSKIMKALVQVIC